MTPPEQASPPPPPRSVGQLEKLVRAYARREGLAEKRVRDWIAYMALAGALEQARGLPFAFLLRGGVAMELRRQGRARATRDIDLTYHGDGDDPVAALDEAVMKGYGRFTFRRTGSVLQMTQVNTSRVEIAAQFDGRPWTTIVVDITPHEPHALETEEILAFDLEGTFGVEGPTYVTCMSARYHLAHKIHGMTKPSTPERPNDRVQDAVDALMLQEITTDLAAVRDACIDVFGVRATHEWPPPFSPPSDWSGQFAQMAEELELAISELPEAIDALQRFIYEIDAATLDSEP